MISGPCPAGKVKFCPVAMSWNDVPRNSILRKEDVESFFSEFDSAKQLSDEEVVRRGAFLVRHMPPKEYRQLKVKRKFTDLAKRLNSVIPALSVISDSMCLIPTPFADTKRDAGDG